MNLKRRADDVCLLLAVRKVGVNLKYKAEAGKCVWWWGGEDSGGRRSKRKTYTKTTKESRKLIKNIGYSSEEKAQFVREWLTEGVRVLHFWGVGVWWMGWWLLGGALSNNKFGIACERYWGEHKNQNDKSSPILLILILDVWFRQEFIDFVTKLTNY